MDKPRICAVVVGPDIVAARSAEKYVDFFEIRIDLVGDTWKDIAIKLNRPWIACNRRSADGGKWRGDETSRLNELVKAAQLGASFVDVELDSIDPEETISKISKRAGLLVSYHDLAGTPSLNTLKKIVDTQLDAGADICKVATTANHIEDNLIVLQLVKEFARIKIISFAMGTQGLLSRVLNPLVGGYFTYASLEKGKESAPGQLTVQELKTIYGMM
jgi:3-dehydroquinate dehydratase I